MEEEKINDLIIARMKKMFNEERNKGSQSYFYIKFLYKFFSGDNKTLDRAAKELDFYSVKSNRFQRPEISWALSKEEARRYFEIKGV
jgi:hypothetical protein